MSVAVIMSDAMGAPNRARAVELAVRAAGADFIRVCPADKLQPGAVVVDLPEEWLPLGETDTLRRHWFRCHLHYVQAAKLISPADFYWCFEADVAASPATWIRLLEQTANRKEDGLWTRLYHRDQKPGIGWFKRWPEWGDWYCLMALCRISAKAMATWEATAEKSREMFTEITAPSSLFRSGLSIGRINQDGQEPFYHCGTMTFNPGRSSPYVSRQAGRFSHPVKMDDKA